MFYGVENKGNMIAGVIGYDSILSRPSGGKKTMRRSRSKKEAEKTNNKCFQRGGSKKGATFLL